MHVRYTSPALNQVADILNQIVDDNPESARNVAKAIDRCVALAAFMPKLGRPVPNRAGTFSMFARPYPYRITYRVLGRELEILAVVHTAREAIA